MALHTPQSDLGGRDGFGDLKLNDAHVVELQKRGIKPEVARARGVSSVNRAAGLQRLGFPKSQAQLIPSLLIPIYDSIGELATYVIRPDTPRSVDGRIRKYEQQTHTKVVVDVPPTAREALRDPHTPLVITEGPLKADAAVSAGLSCVDVLGVWSYREDALPDWDNMRLKGRPTFLAFDSDAMLKKEVHRALGHLLAFLRHRQADAWVAYLPAGKDGQKIGLDDFLVRHSLSDFWDLAERELRALPPIPGATSDGTGEARPPIDVGEQDLAVVTPQIWDAVATGNNPPWLFRYGDRLMRLERDERGAPTLGELTADRLRHEVSRMTWCYRRKDGESKAAKPPPDVVSDMLATTAPPLPRLSRIVEVPVFAPDGTLQTEPGYHAASKTYFSPVPGLRIATVAPDPPANERADARALIVDELLHDFPFDSDADRAHAVALVILPFVRDLIDGPTPNHLIEAPTPGTGKGLLADVATLPAVGRDSGLIPEARNEEERRKGITALLRAGYQVIQLDNVRGTLDSGVLAAALSARVWNDRILGETATLSLPVRCVWITTANNPMMSTEMARRSIRIRLDPRQDQPWRRDPSRFHHPKLQAWASEHRAELVWAALTMVQAWIAAGRPVGTGASLGTFESWSDVVGGILGAAGLPGFLGNLDDLYERADVEGAAWRRLVDSWWESFGNRVVATADLFAAVKDTEGLELKGGDERAQKVSLGMQLRRQCDRVIGDYQIVKDGKDKSATLWRLIPVRVNLGESSESF